MPVIASTELDAINTMLTTIGESPVNSVNASTADTRIAQLILGEVDRATQIKGWNWNTEKEVTLTRNGSNEIVLANNVVRVDVSRQEYPDVEVVQRGNRLYDKKNKTFVFSKDLKGELVYLLPFTDLPEQARYYIVVRSARLFQQRMIGDATGSAFSAEEETTALMALQDSEDETADHNIFNNYDVAKVIAHRRYLV
ncbi:MAG: phage tail protein [Flavobacteriia bacterium]|nr:phage tail protein [Flavobacteriia bacterium]